MATNFDFRILIETNSGSKQSYGTGSFVSLDNNSVLLTTSESLHRINNMPEVQYYNGKTFTTSSGLFFTKSSNTFGNTDAEGDSPHGADYQFVSCSIVGNQDSGSLKFTINETPSDDNDYVKRYKFFGNKVCNVLGLPENYWIYSDAFRLSNTGSEVNYLSGDLLAQSVNIKSNFAISNAGSIETDLPFKHAKDSDRWLKWTNVSGALPTNDMLLGYSNLNDRYELRMHNRDPFLIDSPRINISGSATSSGDFLVQKNANGSSANITIYNSNADSGLDKTATLNFNHSTPSVLGNPGIGNAAVIEAVKTDTYAYHASNFNNSAALVFKTARRNNLNEQMRITQTGRVGIGTDSPGQELEVIGDISASNDVFADKFKGYMPGYFKASTSDSLEGNEVRFFSLGGENAIGDDDRAHAIEYRLMMPYDGYLEKFVMRATATLGATTFRFFKTSTFTDADLTDDGDVSDDDTDDTSNTYQLGADANKTINTVNTSQTFNLGTSYAFSAGDIISMGGFSSGGSSAEIDGMLVVMFKVD